MLMKGPSLLKFVSSLRQYSLSSANVLKTGDILKRARTFSDSDIAEYSKLTHDSNPLHFDLKCAKQAGFTEIPVPGMLLASLFPRIIAFHFPGAVYVKQELDFRSPVFVGDKVVGQVQAKNIRQIKEKFLVKFVTTCFKDGEVVVIDASANKLDLGSDNEDNRKMAAEKRKQASPEECDQAVVGLSTAKAKAKAKAKKLQESHNVVKSIFKRLWAKFVGIGPALRAVASMSREDRAKKLVHWKNEFVSTLQHYWLGCKLLWDDVRISSRLLLKLAGGKNLSRRERQQLTRTAADVFRLVQFAVFIIVPFMEFLLPVFLKLFPNMLPSTFQDKMKEEIELCNSVVDKDGTDGEIETMKANKAASDESEDAKPESNNVSSAFIDKIGAMLQDLEKEIDDVDAKIGDHWRILGRDYDGKVTPEEVVYAALYLKDTLDEEGVQELVSSLAKDADGKILVEDIVRLDSRVEDGSKAESEEM